MRGFIRRFIPPTTPNKYEPVEHVDGIPWNVYFPHHQFVCIEYRALEFDPNSYSGMMRFWERTVADGEPHIHSTFYSGHCDRCGGPKHRFIDHTILLPGDGQTRLHCDHNNLEYPGFALPHIHYDPHAGDGEDASDPFLHDVVVGVPPLFHLRLSFLIKPCRTCLANHWYLIQSHVGGGRHPELHLCFGNPLSRPVDVAGNYRPDDNGNVLGGGGGDRSDDNGNALGGGGGDRDGDNGQPADNNGRNVLGQVGPLLVIVLGVLAVKLLRTRNAT